MIRVYDDAGNVIGVLNVAYLFLRLLAGLLAIGFFADFLFARGWFLFFLRLLAGLLRIGFFADFLFARGWFLFEVILSVGVVREPFAETERI